MNYTESEKAKYEEAWSLPMYGNYSPGEKHVEYFLEAIDPVRDGTILDIGCGAGKGGLALREKGFEVVFTDIIRIATDPVLEPFYLACVWDPNFADLVKTDEWGISPFDCGYCCDVMEHIPQQFSALAIANMLKVCRGVFLSISFQHDSLGRYIGKTLHMNVQSFSWWRDTLRELGRLELAVDCLGEGYFYVTRR